MKTNIVSILFLSSFSLLHAQTKEELNKYFEAKKNQNEAKLEKLLSSKNTTSKEILEEKSKIAGFYGNIPLFWHNDDKSANRSANLSSLQNGSLSGLNSTAIDGSGINIAVFDEGRALQTHNEFGGPSASPLRVVNKEATSIAYSTHHTMVTGLMIAAGLGPSSPEAGISQGVLTKATTENYTYTTTALGDKFQKLNNLVNPNISNHSYGTTSGWYKPTTTSTTYPVIGWYWYANYGLNAQDTYSGAYLSNDQNYDKLVYSNPNHIIVKSAGNSYGDGNVSDGLPMLKWDSTQNKYVNFSSSDVIPPVNCSQGYNCLSDGALAKNIIVVAAANKLTTTNNAYTSASDISKYSQGSAGPRKDGAIKPDITAVGVTVWSPSYTNSSTYNSYNYGSGTSFSAPIISGIAGALTQVQRNLTSNSSFIFKADEMKALLTHTANEAGNPGPDAWYGWGFADAQKAAQLLINKKAGFNTFERKNLTSGTIYSKNVLGKSGEPLKATISWVDPAATPFTTDNDLQNNHSSKLINDLDLRIIDTADNTIYYPWKLDISNPMANATKGDNTVDNVEQVIIDAPVAGRKYRIEVSNKGTLVNDLGAASSQNYALIITGYDSYLATQATQEKEIVVYPTVTKDIVNILIPIKAEKITIFELSGKKVSETAAKSFQIVDLKNLPKGVYLINIQTEKGAISKKVIKE